MKRDGIIRPQEMMMPIRFHCPNDACGMVLMVTLALAPMVNDPSPFVHGDAAKALAAWASRDQEPTLIAMLDNRESSVRRPALEVLGRLKGGRGVPAIAGRLANR